jgi:hypothetical protein
MWPPETRHAVLEFCGTGSLANLAPASRPSRGRTRRPGVMVRLRAWAREDRATARSKLEDLGTLPVLSTEAIEALAGFDNYHHASDRDEFK